MFSDFNLIMYHLELFLPKNRLNQVKSIYAVAFCFGWPVQCFAYILESNFLTAFQCFADHLRVLFKYSTKTQKIFFNMIILVKALVFDPKLCIKGSLQRAATSIFQIFFEMVMLQKVHGIGYSIKVSHNFFSCFSCIFIEGNL